MSEFTEGPWEVRVIGNHKIRMVYPVHEDGPRGFICDDVPSEANANLIISAPDLYAACEWALDRLVNHYGDVGELSSDLEAALAKARGEEVDDG